MTTDPRFALLSVPVAELVMLSPLTSFVTDPPTVDSARATDTLIIQNSADKMMLFFMMFSFL
jgi:hypothetical protein